MNGKTRTLVMLFISIVAAQGFAQSAADLEDYKIYARLNTEVKDNGKTYFIPGDIVAAYGKLQFPYVVKGVTPLAEAGNPAAQYYLASIYYKGGNGVNKDLAGAMAWYAKSASQGFSLAEYMIGSMNENGEGVPASENEAFRWYKRAAEHNNAEGMASLGTLYVQGLGVERDDKQGFEWLKKAADGNSPLGYFNLSLCYINGVGTDRNYAKAATCLGEAIRWNYSERDTAYQYLLELANKLKLPRAYYYIGLVYANGWCHVEKNPAEAFKWWKLAADAGDSEGQYGLFVAYSRGMGTDANQTKSLLSLRSAAQQGQPDAVAEMERMKEQQGIVINNYVYKDGTNNVAEEAPNSIGYSVKQK